MKIIYDYQTFTLQDYGGISRYFSELMKYFHASKEVEFELSLLLSNNHYLNGSAFSEHLSFLKNKNIKGRRTAFLLLNKLYSSSSLSRQEFHVFHPTYYDPYFYKYLKG